MAKKNEYGSPMKARHGKDAQMVHGKLTSPTRSLNPGPAPESMTKLDSTHHVKHMGTPHKKK